MKKHFRFGAIALGSVLALALFTACGDGNKDPDSNPSAGSASVARICYDNLGGGYLAAEETKVAVAGAEIVGGFTSDGVRVNDYSQIAEYSKGVFTAKSAGYVTYRVNGVYGRVEVVPAYITDPGNQYTKNKNLDTSLTSGAKYLGNTHDPSFIEVEAFGTSTYYLFSTGWATGNDVHVSYDNMLTWSYAGKTTHPSDIDNEQIVPAALKAWMGASNNSGDIQWWAPDIVPAPDGGYWLYTCCVAGSNQAKSSGGAAYTPSCDYSMACIVLYHT
ncbi:MAG: hypothetical protein K2H43_02850, partial [Clostridia bacterium]|nr:hypothetical protein [Clostridia bacterium]